MDDLAMCKARAPERFNQLVEEIRAAGTDNASFFGSGYHFEGGLTLQQCPHEFAAAIIFLEENLPQPRGEYLEIGSASGGACRFLVEHLGFTRAWVLDDNGHGRWSEQQANFDALGTVTFGGRSSSFVQKWVGNSHSPQAAAWIEKNVLIAPSLSFIDGDHSYEGCWGDFVMMHAFLKGKPGPNLVMFHDIVACEGVVQSWNQAIAQDMIEPLAAYAGPGIPGTNNRPLAIGIGRVK